MIGVASSDSPSAIFNDILSHMSYSKQATVFHKLCLEDMRFHFFIVIKCAQAFKFGCKIKLQMGFHSLLFFYHIDFLVTLHSCMQLKYLLKCRTFFYFGKVILKPFDRPLYAI